MSQWGFIHRFRKRRRTRHCDHEWSRGIFQPGAAGWTMVQTCLHCGEERREATSRRRVRRTAATRQTEWQEARRRRRSAFKGIYTTDDAERTARASARRLRAIDRELVRRIGGDPDEIEHLREAA